MQPLRRLEIAAWTCGSLLALSYCGVRAWSAQASVRGIEALEAVHTEQAIVRPATVQERFVELPQPDTSTWSKQRLAAYQEGIRRREVPAAVLKIPQLKLTVPVYEGTSALNLNRGAGRIEGTDRFGAAGNVGIAGHRDGFFRNLKDVKGGEMVYIDTPDDTLTYRIVATKIVDPEDTHVLATTGKPTITLVTCYPFYFIGSAPKRFIVSAERVVKPGAAQRFAGL